MHDERVRHATMTVIYSGQHYHLTEDSVTVRGPGESPRAVELEALPLPVARALHLWRTSGGVSARN